MLDIGGKDHGPSKQRPLCLVQKAPVTGITSNDKDEAPSRWSLSRICLIIQLMQTALAECCSVSRGCEWGGHNSVSAQMTVADQTVESPDRDHWEDR